MSYKHKTIKILNMTDEEIDRLLDTQSKDGYNLFLVSNNRYHFRKEIKVIKTRKNKLLKS